MCKIDDVTFQLELAQGFLDMAKEQRDCRSKVVLIRNIEARIRKLKIDLDRLGVNSHV